MNREQRLKFDAYRAVPLNPRRLLVRALPLLLALLVFRPGEALSQQGGVVAVIYSINGRIDFRENDKADWKPAKKGQGLYGGQQLRTETGNKAMILYNLSGSSVLVNENTQIEIQAQATAAGAKPSKERTKLIMGQVYSRIKKGNQYEVETPSSVASVRGTEFDSQYNIETDEATFLVLESSVELMNQLGSIILQPLQTSTVKRGEKPKEPDTLTKNQADNLTKWKAGVEPKWRLNIAPEGGADHETGSMFDIGISVVDSKTSSLDNSASFSLKTFEASADIIEFSTDNGKSWSTTPLVRVTNGTAVIKARVTAEGSADLTASADDAEPGQFSITVTKAKEKKRIEIQFTDQNGTTTKSLILELEEK